MLTDELDYVLGVDTHRDEHVIAVVTAPAGALVAGAAAPAIEGTGSYGAGLARFLAERGELVLELSRRPRAERRLRGKDDTLDAARTARAALGSETQDVVNGAQCGDQRTAPAPGHRGDLTTGIEIVAPQQHGFCHVTALDHPQPHASWRSALAREHVRYAGGNRGAVPTMSGAMTRSE